MEAVSRADVCAGVEEGEAVVSGGDVDCTAVVEILAVVEMPSVVEVATVVASRVDVPVLVAVEVVARGEVGVAVVPVGEVFSRAVLRVRAEVVAGGGLVPGAEEDVSARAVGGEAVASEVLVVTRAGVDVAAGLEVTAVDVAAAGLGISALVVRSVEAVSRADVCA